MWLGTDGVAALWNMKNYYLKKILFNILRKDLAFSKRFLKEGEKTSY